MLCTKNVVSSKIEQIENGSICLKKWSEATTSITYAEINWSCTDHVTAHALMTWLFGHWSRVYQAVISDWQALIRDCARTDQVADQELTTWPRMQWSRGWSPKWHTAIPKHLVYSPVTKIYSNRVNLNMCHRLRRDLSSIWILFQGYYFKETEHMLQFWHVCF